MAKKGDKSGIPEQAFGDISTGSLAIGKAASLPLIARGYDEIDDAEWEDAQQFKDTAEPIGEGMVRKGFVTED